MILTEITDDLTGAADSGSYYTARGKRLRICLSGEAEFNREGTDIVAVNLSSRNVLPQLAKELHFNLCSEIVESSGGIFFKKIGTGFRGNDQYELQGMLDACPEYNVFIIDNAPDLGTFTLYGHQYCEGEILHKSLYAKDPVSPPTKSYIPEILSEGSDYKVGLVDIDSVKCGTILEKTEKLISDGYRIIVFDAITKEDTLKIISTLLPIYPKTFWTGSLGIADGLGKYLYGEWSREVIPKRELRCLGFSASDYSIAKKQIAYSEGLGLNVIRVDVDSYIDGDDSVLDAVINDAKEKIRDGNTFIVPKINKYSFKPGANLKILECFQKIVRPICDGTEFDRLIIVGGETAQNVFAALETDHINVTHPLAPGIAQGVIEDGMLAGKEYALKGGSMGHEDTLEAMMCRKEVVY